MGFSPSSFRIRSSNCTSGSNMSYALVFVLLAEHDLKCQTNYENKLMIEKPNALRYTIQDRIFNAFKPLGD